MAPHRRTAAGTGTGSRDRSQGTGPALRPECVAEDVGVDRRQHDVVMAVDHQRRPSGSAMSWRTLDWTAETSLRVSRHCERAGWRQLAVAWTTALSKIPIRPGCPGSDAVSSGMTEELATRREPWPNGTAARRARPAAEGSGGFFGRSHRRTRPSASGIWRVRPRVHDLVLDSRQERPPLGPGTSWCVGRRPMEANVVFRRTYNQWDAVA